MCKLSLFVIVLHELFAGNMGWNQRPNLQRLQELQKTFTPKLDWSNNHRWAGEKHVLRSSSSFALVTRGGCRGAGWALPTLSTVTAVSANPGWQGRLWSVVSQRISIPCDTSPKAQGRVQEIRSVTELISCLYFMRYWISEEHSMKEPAELQSWGRTDVSAALLGSACSASSLCTGKICQAGLYHSEQFAVNSTFPTVVLSALWTKLLSIPSLQSQN